MSRIMIISTVCKLLTKWKHKMVKVKVDKRILKKKLQKKIIFQAIRKGNESHLASAMTCTFAPPSCKS